MSHLERQTNALDGRPPGSVEEGASDGAAFKAVALPSRRAPAAIALLAIAVLAVALLTKQAAPPPAVPTVVDRPPPSLAGTVSSSAGPPVATTPSPSSGAASRNPTVTPRPTFVAVAAEAGTTQLISAGSAPVRLTISLPQGWEKASDAMYVKSNGEAPAGISIGAWRIQHVNFVPCRWSSQSFADPSLMRTAEGQAEALSAWWGQDPNLLPYWTPKIAPLASKRLPATIGGRSAWYLEVLIPRGYDFAECDGGQLVLWDTASGDVRYGLGPGEHHRLWVVDAGGGPIVIDAASFPGTSPADVGELRAIIDSVVIGP